MCTRSRVGPHTSSSEIVSTLKAEGSVAETYLIHDEAIATAKYNIAESCCASHVQCTLSLCACQACIVFDGEGNVTRLRARKRPFLVSRSPTDDMRQPRRSSPPFQPPLWFRGCPCSIDFPSRPRTPYEGCSWLIRAHVASRNPGATAECAVLGHSYLLTCEVRS